MTKQRIAELIGATANDSTVFYVMFNDFHVAVLEHTYYVQGQRRVNFIFAKVENGQTVKKVTVKTDATDRQVVNAWVKVTK